MDSELVKINIDILKTKLTFFASVVGGIMFLFINIDKINKFFNQYILAFGFIMIGFYGIIGVIKNLTELNRIKQKVELKYEL